MQVDKTGKVTLDHIYTQPDPRLYFDTLRDLDYHIPQLAKPYFQKLLAEYRETQGVATPTVLDIGSGYGINAALLKCDLSMEDLYSRYTASAEDREALVTRDREMVRSRSRFANLRLVGLDVSGPALAYGLDTGLLDDAVHADLEKRDLTDGERSLLGSADIVISTGCLGYVTERTLSRVIGAHRERRPWMAHFVLRMFPFDPIEECLSAAGYETVRQEGVFRQRRFAGPTEQSLVLDRLSRVGVDPRGLETDGWLYAELHISRPARQH